MSRLNNLLAERARGRAIVDVQNPVYLDHWSLPQPDLALLRPRPDLHRGPGPEGYGAVEIVRRGADLEVAALPCLTLGADSAIPTSA